MTTLKQQDRAPLLNIPLGPSYAATTSSPVAKADAVCADILDRQPSSPEPKPQLSSQHGWEFLIAPKPILAATAPAAEESAWARTPPGTPLPVSPATSRPTASTPQVKATSQAAPVLDDSDSERPIAIQKIASSSPAAKVAAEPLEATTIEKPRIDQPEVNQYGIDEVLSDAAGSRKLNPFEGPSQLAASEVAELPKQTPQPSVSMTTERPSSIQPAESFEAAANVVAEKKSPLGKPRVADEGRVVRSQSASLVAETLPFVERSSLLKPAEPSVSAQLVQVALSVPMSSAAILPKSLSGRIEPAKTANHSQLDESEATKKKERSPMRRPPLHRRFQLERPVTASSAGSNTVTRKLRLDQIGGTDETTAAQSAEAIASSVAPETKIVSNSPKAARRFRIDSAEGTSEVTGTDGRRKRTQTPPKQRYIDDAHDSQLRGPHFEISAPKRSNLTSMTGQFLAYMGVLGLTIGTAMVIYGHFGGYSEYTPTGWLVTTVAQMLLFLGVINLVSGGIEQNNDDVSRRINTLGEQLLRIEQVTSEAMRGPKLPAHLYDDPESEAAESTREKVAAHRE